MSQPDPASLFLEEAAELLIQLEETLLKLEHAPGDRDLVDTAFRALHTIKGSAGMFGFDAVSGFTHHLESAFEKVRKGELAAGPDLVGLALSAIDHIRALLDDPETAAKEVGAGILARVATITGTASPAREAAARHSSPEDEPASRIWSIRFKLAENAMAMGTDPLRLLAELRELGPCTVVARTESIPALEEIDPSGCYLAWDVILTTDSPKTAIEDVFIFVMDDSAISIDPVIEGEEARLGDILVLRGDARPEQIENAAAALPRLGDVLVSEGVVSGDQLNSALAEQRHVRAEAGRTQAQAQSGTIRVPAERLDGLMDQVGELVIAQARLKQLVSTLGDSPIKSVAEEIERLSNGLRDSTMGIRTVEIGALFKRFKRLVRDTSRDLGKEIALVTSGEETELDKTIVEQLNDPLVHIVRNAIDHGIEHPDVRGRQGKPSHGTVTLSALHAGAQVQIRIRDDGKGLDRERIRAKAVENGLIDEDARLSDQDLYQFIFHPGFSTAREVTSLSGRGVGMDVVKRTIDSLRGTIHVESAPGAGTEITLQLPLTLAIIDGLLVRVGNGHYVIALSAVEECVELATADDLPDSGRNLLGIRGDLVPFIRLRDMFRSIVPADRHQKVVVVSIDERRVGLVVDQVVGEHQTVIKSLSPLHADLPAFSGATILGDGTVALILDVAAIARAEQAPEPERLAS